MNDNTKRFSDRVEDYIKYRPNYPEKIVKILEEKTNLDKDKTIADIGSGTGISSKLFLENDYKVIGVEPNKEMSKIEFDRILKKNGNIVLVWNSRSDKSAFQNEYEKILYDNIEEYKSVNHRNIKDEEISNFFFPKKMNKTCLDNNQILNLER